MTEVYFNQTKISEKEKQLAMVVGIITCGSSPSKQKEAVFQLEAPAYSTPEGLLNLVAEEYLLLSNEFQTVNHALLPENPTIHPSANIGFPEIIDQDNPQTLNDLGYELVLRVVEKVFHQYKQDKSGTIWRQINQVCQNWQGPLAKALRLHSEVGFKAIYAGGIEYLDLFLQTIKI